MRESLESALSALRPGFEADGFEVSVESVEPGGVVNVRVGHTPKACEECLVPDDMLTAMLKTVMQRVVPDVTRVVIRHEKAG